MTALPPEALLALHPPAMQAIADRLRVLVRRAEPDVLERVRAGWHLIGYDVPVGRRTAYFAYIAPEDRHVHLGFEHGVLMADPAGHLQGAGITRQVRWLTFTEADAIDDDVVLALLHEAARVARLSRGERALLREVRPVR